MKKLKMKILNWIVKEVFSGITKEDVFVLQQGKEGKELLINGERATDKQVLAYRTAALKILEANVWQDIKKQIELAANRRMYEKSEHIDDLFFGKAMLLNLDLIDEYLKMLSNLK